MILQRDRRMGIDSTEKRREREQLAAVARPQDGVDAIAKPFPNAGRAARGETAKPGQPKTE